MHFLLLLNLPFELAAENAEYIGNGIGEIVNFFTDVYDNYNKYGSGATIQGIYKL